MTTCYQIYSSTLTATSVSQTSLQVVRKGRIIGVAATVYLLGAAGGTGGMHFGIEKNTNGGTTSGVNNPQRQAQIARCAGGWNVSTATFINFSIPAISIPVEVGDVLNLSSVLTGTAPAAGIGYFSVYVEE